MANQTRRLAAVPEAIRLLKDTLTRQTISKTEANERYDMKESMDSLKRWWQRMGFRKGLSIVTKYGQCKLFDYL